MNLRRFRNDRAPLPERVDRVVDPAREAKRFAELRRKISYMEQHYRLELKFGFDRQNFNRSLARLKNAVNKPTASRAPQKRLHPWLEFAINIKARELAGVAHDAPLLREHDSYVQQAALHVATHAEGLRGAPAHDLLKSYVAGLVALFEEATGQRLQAPRDKDSVYDPQLLGSAGKALRTLVDHVQPGITDTLLSRWVRQAQRQKGGTLRFRDLYPGYDATVEPGAKPRLLPPYRIDKLIGVSQPIYSP